MQYIYDISCKQLYSYHQNYISEQKTILTAFLFSTCMIHFRSCSTGWCPSNVSKPVKIIIFFFLCEPTYFIIFKTTETLCFSCKRKTVRLFYEIVLCVDTNCRSYIILDRLKEKIPTDQWTSNVEK